MMDIFTAIINGMEGVKSVNLVLSTPHSVLHYSIFDAAMARKARAESSPAALCDGAFLLWPVEGVDSPCPFASGSRVLLGVVASISAGPNVFPSGLVLAIRAASSSLKLVCKSCVAPDFAGEANGIIGFNPLPALACSPADAADCVALGINMLDVGLLVMPCTAATI